MKTWLHNMLPSTLKHRLVAAFIFLILLPFSMLMLHHFSKLESILRQTFSEQSQEQMQQINLAFDDLISQSYRTYVLLDQDSIVRRVLQEPDHYHLLERISYIEEKFRAINNSLFITTPQVYYTLADLHGHVYSSFMPSQPFPSTYLDHSPLMLAALESAKPYTIDVENNYVQADFTTSPDLLSLHVAMRDNNYRPYAVTRISIDYYDWFQTVTKRYSLENKFALVRTDNVLNLRPTEGDEDNLSYTKLESLEEPNGSYIEGEFFINYSFMPSLGWYLVKQVPTEVVFSEVRRLKKSFFTTFSLLIIAFIIMTFVISSAITNPLKRLQKHMSSVAESNLKIHVPEVKSTAEISQLTRSFNRMVGDIHVLVQQLKLEERRKEAVHFRMLHSQTNPHFLLNTLNTIKWLAWKENNHDVVEICIALGKLLEAGLNSDKELIYLKDELDLVHSYIQIQQFRYKKQYEIQFHYEDTISYALVPKLSLQPLVDNAIKHGFTGKDKGRIEIEITAMEDKLQVSVQDNGIGPVAAQQFASSSKEGHGIGLNNLRERLELLFKDKANLFMQPLPEGTLVKFQMPLLISTPYGEEEEI